VLAFLLHQRGDDVTERCERQIDLDALLHAGACRTRLLQGGSRGFD
jgi:hypothetical protein